MLGSLPAACGLTAAEPARVATLDDLRRLDPGSVAGGSEVVVEDPARGGRFRWDPGSTRAEDGGIIFASDRSRTGRWVRVVAGPINAAWFGAAPGASGARNSIAFASAAAAINRAGGGTLLVPPGRYEVGTRRVANHRGPGAAVPPQDVIRIEDCSKPVLLRGHGAILRVVDGVKFGSFHPATGRRHDPPTMPFLDFAYRHDGCRMIYIRHCSGPVRIEGFELDGNMQNYDLGGEWGDTGRQLVAAGIMLESNTGAVTIAEVNSHDHGLDGIWAAHYHLRPDSPPSPVTLVDVTCDRNGRQGLSWVGGTALTALRCRFSRTGRGRFASAPAAGVDVEAELSVCRNGRFIECEFVDNAGVGFLAEAGDIAGIRLDRCTFIGTTQWSCWPHKPDIMFRDCLFVGSVVNVFASEDPARATRFLSCRFVGDTALSPTGAVFGPYLADLGGGADNVLMSDCEFAAVSPEIALPWSLPHIRYHDCRFRQAGTNASHPRGIFTGTCHIVSAGTVDLAGSRFAGTVFLNGTRLS